MLLIYWGISVIVCWIYQGYEKARGEKVKMEDYLLAILFGWLMILIEGFSRLGGYLYKKIESYKEDDKTKGKTSKRKAV